MAINTKGRKGCSCVVTLRSVCGFGPHGGNTRTARVSSIRGLKTVVSRYGGSAWFSSGADARALGLIVEGDLAFLPGVPASEGVIALVGRHIPVPPLAVRWDDGWPHSILDRLGHLPARQEKPLNPNFHLTRMDEPEANQLFGMQMRKQ